MIPVIVLRGVEAIAAAKAVRGGQADPLRLLPKFDPGDILSARVEARLPDGNYKVTLAGQPMSMALPSHFAPGDRLELAFVAREPRLTFALRDIPQAAAAPAPSLSAAGRLIAATMLPAGGRAAVTVLSGVAPLFASMPADGARLSGTLAQTLAASGLFYESHQAEWLAGKRDLAQIRQEPQARLTLATAGAAAAPEAAGVGASARTSGAQALVASANASHQTESTASTRDSVQMRQDSLATPSTLRAADGFSAAAAPHAAELPTAAAAPRPGAFSAAAAAPQSGDLFTAAAAHRPGDFFTAAAALPTVDLSSSASARSQEQMIDPRTTALVQQQLAALDSARVVLQLEVWPKQWMQWEIDEHRPGAGREPDAPQSWNTQLRLDLPQLGDIKAALTLGGDGMRIRLEAASGASAALMREHCASLQAAFATAGLPPAAIAIAHHDQT